MTDVPLGWAKTTLDSIAEVRLGRQRSPKNHYGTRMRPYLRAANVTWSGLNLAEVKEMQFTEDESVIYELRAGDLLVAEASGSASEVGKPALWRGEIPDCCFQNTLVRVRSLGPIPEYLRYFVLHEARSGRVGRAAPGVGIHHIGATRLAAWPVPLPPLAEQRRIVAAIEEQFSRLDAASSSLARQLRRLGVLRGLVIALSLNGSWPPVPLADVGDGTRHALAIGPFGSNLKVSDYRDVGIPLVFVRNIRSRSFGAAATRFVTDEKASELAAHAVRPGDVLITKMGEPPGDTAVFPEGTPAGIITADCIKITPGPEYDARYLAFAIAAEPARRQIIAITKGVAQKKVSLARFKTVTIPAPPLAEQRRIVAELEQQLSLIDALRAAVESAQKRSAALRRAIRERAFRGELVPQDPADEPASVLLERIRAERAADPVAQRRRRAAL